LHTLDRDRERLSNGPEPAESIRRRGSGLSIGSHRRLPFRRRFGGLDAFLARHSRLHAYWLWTRGLREFDLKACQARLLGDNAVTGPDGGPLPETAFAFERNIRTMVNLGRSWGARSFLVTMPHRTPAPHEETLVTAMHGHNQRLRRLATTLGSGLIDLAEVFRDRDDCFEDLVHFKLEKRVDKAAAIAMALWKAESCGNGERRAGPSTSGGAYLKELSQGQSFQLRVTERIDPGTVLSDTGG